MVVAFTIRIGGNLARRIESVSLEYRIRKATAADIDVILAQRHAMFTEMGIAFDRGELARAFVPWIHDAMAREIYHGWLVEDGAGQVIAGGGVTVLPWPPAPQNLAGRISYVYNVYTDHAHRRRGLARRVMDVVHAWSRERGIALVALHASDEGRRLYESMGYEPSTEMRLLL
jgi:GNAT superfamily N-acetyltransferase